MLRAYGVIRLSFTTIKCHKHLTEVHKILSIHYLLLPVLQEDSGIVLDEIVARKNCISICGNKHTFGDHVCFVIVLNKHNCDMIVTHVANVKQ